MRMIGSLLLVGLLAAGCGGEESVSDALLPSGTEAAEEGGEAAEEGGEAAAEEGGEAAAEEGGEAAAEEGGEAAAEEGGEAAAEEGGEAAAQEGGEAAGEEGGEAGEEGGEAAEEGGEASIDPVEDCTNGTDDDNDGLIDCEDPDCVGTDACPGGGPGGEGGEGGTPAGTCAGSCGSPNPTAGGCYCDELCVEYGDCCEDVCDECAELSHCGGGGLEGGEGGEGGGEPCPEGLTYEGCCADNVVTWCENGVVATADCTPDSATCTWDGDAGFYACRDVEEAVEDPSGVNPLQCSLPAGEEGGETGTEEGGEAGTEEGGEATTEEGGEATTEEGGEATTEEGGEAVEMMNIVDTAVAAGDFTTLVAAVTAADLAATLSDESAEFTVFAPTDAAFDALPEGTVDGLLADIPALTDILLYHVVAGKVPAADVLGLTSAATLQGSNVSIKVEGGEVFLNDTVKVTTTDIMCTNGIIHVIDGVLIPAE